MTLRLQTHSAVLLVACLVVNAAHAASTPGQDAKLDAYFAIWADNGRVTKEAVDQLYAPRVIYYGKEMTRSQVYRDKLAFIRSWPDRHYSIAPGSATKSCAPREEMCTLTAILLWEAHGPHGSRSGRSRIKLELARQDGSLTIARESGNTLRH